jgi:hypothetical protein
MYKTREHSPMTAIEAPPTIKRVVKSEKEKHVNSKATIKESKLRRKKLLDITVLKN